jgi:hypothetical protein
MGLFSIFKRKADQQPVIVPTDSIKALPDGILFEEENIFLKWGTNPEADKQYVKKEFRADRVIYQWGERTILNGLKLPFKTVCWNHKQHGENRSIESMDFSMEGDGAEAKFDIIKKHIESILGEAKQQEDLEPGEVSLEWKVKAVKISLNFYNRDQPKVHLEIGWWI